MTRDEGVHDRGYVFANVSFQKRKRVIALKNGIRDGAFRARPRGAPRERWPYSLGVVHLTDVPSPLGLPELFSTPDEHFVEGGVEPEMLRDDRVEVERDPFLQARRAAAKPGKETPTGSRRAYAPARAHKRDRVPASRRCANTHSSKARERPHCRQTTRRAGPSPEVGTGGGLSLPSRDGLGAVAGGGC